MEADKSKIKKANVPVLVQRPKAAIELEELDIPVHRSLGRGILIYWGGSAFCFIQALN